MVSERRLKILDALRGSHWCHVCNIFGITRPGIDPTPIVKRDALYHFKYRGSSVFFSSKIIRIHLVSVSEQHSDGISPCGKPLNAYFL